MCHIHNCTLQGFHMHCNYCKGMICTNARSNCDKCSAEITAKNKLARVKSLIKKKLHYTNTRIKQN